MSLRSVILATATLCAYVADAHVLMKAPVPYSVDKIDNSPITKAQYPCKSQNGFTVSTMNSMAVGEKQTLTLSGSAVHGGGSCQLSVTLDTEPTASSVFKVIKSMEGGCPGVSGEAEAYDFTLPDSIPNGKATFAWTWFSKLSGGPELYMNCAPIEVTGGASDDSKFQELPDMLVANIDDTCKSVPNFAVQFPDPGSVVTNGGTNDLKAPTGTGCGATGTTPANSSSSAGSGASATSAAAGEASAAPTSAAGNDGMYTPPAGASSAAATSAAAALTSAAGGASAATSEAAVTSAAATGSAGGVFAPGASSAAAGASTQTTLVTVTGTPATPAESTAAASEPAATTPVAATSAAGTGSSGATATTAPAASGDGTCTTDGAIVCNGTTQFGICNQGKVVWQDVAAGTTCSNGTIQKRGYNGRIVRRNRGLVGHIHKH